MDPITGEVPEIPSTVEKTDQLIEEAVILTQRTKDSPDFQTILVVVNRVHRLSIFNWIYSLVLTIVIMVNAFLGWYAYTNGNLVKQIQSSCDQISTARILDLASWTYIVNQLAPNSPVGAEILRQRAEIDVPVEC